jgi:hypothetical protein
LVNRAAEAFLANFAHAPVNGRTAEEMLARVLSDQRDALAAAGL